jgi:hypothetical protein
MAGTTLRFVILGDDRASSAFDRWTRSVDKSNTAMARSQVALRSQQKQADATAGSFGGLTGKITGFSDVTGAASSKGSVLTRVLSGLNVATGVAEPALAGLLVTAGGLAAVFASGAVGLVAYKVALTPLLKQTQAATVAQKKLETAQTSANIAYKSALAGGATQAAASAARTRTLTTAQQQYNAAVKEIPAPVRQFSRALDGVQTTYTKWADSLARPVLRPLSEGLGLVKPVLRGISPLVRAAAAGLTTLERLLSAKIAAGGLTSFVAEIRPHIIPAILAMGTAVGNVASGIWGIIKAFLPVADKVGFGVTHLTGLFKDWANSLPQHSGFQSLMATFQQSTPLAVQVLKNLVLILHNVATATVGLASPANSKALLQILIPLTQVMAKLTANQGLVRTVLYLVLLKGALGQVKGALLGVKSGVDTFSKVYTGAQKAYGVVGRLAGGFRSATVAESAFSGTAGTLGGKLRAVWTAVASTTGAVVRSTGAWIANAASLVAGKVAMAAVWTWQKLVTAAQWLWNIAMDANPIGAVVLGLTALVTGLVLAYKHFAGFRMVVQAVWTWIKEHWPLLLGILLGPVGLAVVAIIKHWKSITAGAAAVLGWVRSHWPLLLAILAGPIGLAVLAIVKHWHTITGAASAAFAWIKSHWPLLLAILTGPIGLLVKFAIDHFHTFQTTVSSVLKSVEVFFLHMIDGMLDGLRVLTGALGHLPGRFGAPFRAASAAIDGTRDHIHKLIGDLTGIHSKQVGITITGSGTYTINAPGTGGKRIVSGVWTGGPIRGPGGPTEDKAGLYALSNNEWVIRANAAAHYGDRAMAAVNRGTATILHRGNGMATGGRVAGGYSGTPQGLGAFDTREYNATIKVIEDATAKAAAKAILSGGGWGQGSGRKLVNFLRPYVGRVPYVWGGMSPAGWDCSGMTGYGLKHANGITAPRTSESQYAWVRRTNDQVGALAFFVSPAGGAPPGHVGVSMGNGAMINAAGTLSGTTISGTGGAMGFGVPPGMATGGKITANPPVARKPDPQRKAWLAQLARYVANLKKLRKAAGIRRPVLRHSVEIDQLWFLTHPNVKKGGIGWNEHQKALRSSQRRLAQFNKRETARETALGRKIALLRDLTGFPQGLKYGGPGAPAPVDDGGLGDDGGGGDGTGDGGGGTTAPAPPPIPPPPMPAWMVAAGLGGPAPAGMAGAGMLGGWAARMARPGWQSYPYWRGGGRDPIGVRFPRAAAPGQAGAGTSGPGDLAEMIESVRAMHRDVVSAVRGVAPGVSRGVDDSLSGMTTRVAGRIR